MNIFLFLIVFFISISCERHVQDGFVLGKSQGQVVTVVGVDALFEALSSDDYFYLEREFRLNEYDLNIENDRGNLLLNEAIKLKRVLIAILLIQQGADPYQLDKSNMSASNLISTYENKSDWEEIISGKLPSTDFLSKKVSDIIASTAIDNQDATLKKDGDIFEMGADVNSQNSRGFTLLMNAALKGLPKVVGSLCQHPQIDLEVKFRRMNVFDLLKRQMRRNPSLKEILNILENCTN